jgi:hypothetical protein
MAEVFVEMVKGCLVETMRVNFGETQVRKYLAERLQDRKGSN